MNGSTQKMPELLSPAGGVDSVYAAVNSGCNAVYLGGKQFSARQAASNFSLEELETVCDYCHTRQVKVYVTVNTLYKDTELPQLLDFVASLYQIGVDAFILQDLGAASLIQEYFPQFPLHASTQLTATSIEDVKFLEQHGFSKIVLSRELSLEEIIKIKQSTGVALETFIHGALCVSYSGQCLMSSILGGRSGNRGRCAQTCRLPYTLCQKQEEAQEGYLLCPKDMETLSILPKLIEAGIDSFKIEGRMKSPEYVAGVTEIYRKYIDAYFEHPEQYEVSNTDKKILLQLFNRGGFTEGYYFNHSGKNMMSVERPKPWGLMVGFIDQYQQKAKRATIRTREPFVPGDGIEVWTQTEPHTGTNIQKASRPGEVISVSLEGNIHKNDPVYKTYDKVLMDRLKKSYTIQTRKKEIFAKLTLKHGEAAALKVWDLQGNFSFVTGETVQAAKNQPMSQEKISQQIQKTGGTPFFIQNLELDCDSNLFISIQSLNTLRREGLELLEENIIKRSKRPMVEKKPAIALQKAPVQKQKKMNILVNTKEQFSVAVAHPGTNIIYLEMNDALLTGLSSAIRDCKRENKQLFIALPRVCRSDTEECYSAWLAALEENHTEIDGYLVRSVGQLQAVLQHGKMAIVDYTMNPFNQAAVSYFQKLGAELVSLSVELNVEEIGSASNEHCEMLVYGYIPVMVTHQCPIGAYAGGKDSGMYCKKRGTAERFFLKDRKGVKFPLFPDCKQCVCTILNSRPLFTLKFFDEILNTPTGFVRLAFTLENKKETENMINAYADLLTDAKHISLDTQILLEEMEEHSSTKGHFFRGVE